MKIECTRTQEELLALGWTAARRQKAADALAHLQQCEICRSAAAEYEAIRAPFVEPEVEAPRGGWEAFESRLTQTAQRGSTTTRNKWRWTAVAAALFGALTLANLAMLMHESRNTPANPGPIANPGTVISNEVSDETLVKAFSNVAPVFDGHASWVMLSDQTSELGLADGQSTGKDLLILRFVVSRGGKAVSQMNLAMVPGATARVTVPSKTGDQLQYVITTDAADLQRVGVWMSVESNTAAAGLGSMATSLKLPLGKDTPTGTITTPEGVFDLSMSLQHGSTLGA